MGKTLELSCGASLLNPRFCQKFNDANGKNQQGDNPQDDRASQGNGQGSTEEPAHENKRADRYLGLDLTL